VTQNFVLDSSVALAWCFKDEATAETNALLQSLAGQAVAHVPTLWFWEVTNSIAVAERRGRITAAESQQHISFLVTLPIAVEMGAHQHAWWGSLTFARQHTLSIYDAAYLDLAHRLGLPLATLDSSLQRAARAIGADLVT
jgi:predicted nucleic acid-binding protein